MSRRNAAVASGFGLGAAERWRAQRSNACVLRAASIVADGRLPSRQQEDPPQANTTTSSTIEGNFGMLTLC
jgi:hypothetical protein